MKKLSVALRNFANPFRNEFYVILCFQNSIIFLQIYLRSTLLNQYILSGKFMAVYCENHIELTSTMFMKFYSVMMLKPTLHNVAIRPGRISAIQ